MKPLGRSAPVFIKPPRRTKRENFLGAMAPVVPWQRWVERSAPYYPVAGQGRRPFPLETMRRLHRMPPWFGDADPAMEAALHEVPLRRDCARLDVGEDAMPDETTLLSSGAGWRGRRERRDCSTRRRRSGPNRAYGDDTGRWWRPP